MLYTTLRNKKVLITAGPTQEAIDPVRYISNHSSGKMGYAIAETFLGLGATVYLVSGPVCMQMKPHQDLQITNVRSASEMYLACCRFFEEVDIAVFAAAVADFRPEKIVKQKIKKGDNSFSIRMVENPDIAYEFGRIKTGEQLSVGFALETDNELSYAISKLARKNFDMVILNSMNDANAGFGYDTNKISIIKKDLTLKQFPLKSKKLVAEDIVAEISGILSKNESNFIERDVYDYENMYR